MKNSRYPLILGAVAGLALVALLALVLLPGGAGPVEEAEETNNEPDIERLSPDSRLPDNWESLNLRQKIQLNYHRCQPSDNISPDNGRCRIDIDRQDSNYEFEAEYVYISHSGPQSYFPLPESTYIYIAVPDSASDEQVEVVFNKYILSRYEEENLTAGLSASEQENFYGVANRLGMSRMVIYNYSDVVFGDDYYHGRQFTGDPRTVRAYGLGGIDYEYLGNTVLEAGRDGSTITGNCIAIDLDFLILSDPTVDQLKAYYSTDSLFWVAMGRYLEMGAGYDLRFPEAARQKRSDGEVNYDIRINLFREDPLKYYLSLFDDEEAVEHELLSELPSISINGCQ